MQDDIPEDQSARIFFNPAYRQSRRRLAGLLRHSRANQNLSENGNQDSQPGLVFSVETQINS